MKKITLIFLFFTLSINSYSQFFEGSISHIVTYKSYFKEGKVQRKINDGFMVFYTNYRKSECITFNKQRIKNKHRITEKFHIDSLFVAYPRDWLKKGTSRIASSAPRKFNKTSDNPNEIWTYLGANKMGKIIFQNPYLVCENIIERHQEGLRLKKKKEKLRRDSIKNARIEYRRKLEQQKKEKYIKRMQQKRDDLVLKYGKDKASRIEQQELKIGDTEAMIKEAFGEPYGITEKYDGTKAMTYIVFNYKIFRKEKFVFILVNEVITEISKQYL